MPSAPMTKVPVTMRNPSRHVLGLILICLPVASSASVQAASRRTEQKAEQKPLMAEDVFKNVQLLKGIPVKEFMNTMGFFSAAASTPAFRRRPGRRQDGRSSFLSRADQARVPMAHGLPVREH